MPFLKGLPDRVLRKLQPNIRRQQYSAGQRILKAGQYCDGAYYLTSGLVEVLLATPDGETSALPSSKPATKAGSRWLARLTGKRAGSAPTPLDRSDGDLTAVLPDFPVNVRPGDRAFLEPGDIFGEISALSRYAVSSDVIAVGDVECWLIATVALRLMFGREELSSFKQFYDARYRDRSLGAALRAVTVFRDLDNETLDRLRVKSDLLSFAPGVVIVEQGAAPDGLYLVRGGFVRVAAKTGGAEVAVTYLRKGDCAGEASLLLDEPWPFSLQALEHVEIVRIPREALGDLLDRASPTGERLWDSAVLRLKQRGAALADPLGARQLQYAMDSGLIHGESVLLIDLDKCTRCDDCVRACAEVHDGTPRFVREGPKFQNFSVPTACYQCTDPVCMIGCPTGAISRPLGTLEVTINKDTCIACGTCSGDNLQQGPGCPWHNIQPYSRPGEDPKPGVRTKCDLCVGRADGPACVQMCPHGATVRVNFKEFEATRRLLGGSE